MSNPTESEIETALWTHLNALAPNWTTALPGDDGFKPTGGPWQRGTWMPGDPGKPVAYGAGAYHRQTGIYQVDLFYPKSELRTDLVIARGTLVRQHFYPDAARGAVIEAGGGELIISQRPHVTGVDKARDAAHFVVTVSVLIRIELPPG